MSKIKAGKLLNNNYWNNLTQLKESDDLTIQGEINIGELLSDLRDHLEILQEKRQDIFKEYGVEVEKEVGKENKKKKIPTLNKSEIDDITDKQEEQTEEGLEKLDELAKSEVEIDKKYNIYLEDDEVFNSDFVGIYEDIVNFKTE